MANVRSTGFSRNPGEEPPKGGTTNDAFPAGFRLAKRLATSGRHVLRPVSSPDHHARVVQLFDLGLGLPVGVPAAFLVVQVQQPVEPAWSITLPAVAPVGSGRRAPCTAWYRLCTVNPSREFDQPGEVINVVRTVQQFCRVVSRPVIAE